MLKCERKMVYEVDYSDLERFIDKEFGHSFNDTYDLPCLEEQGNDVYMEFSVDGYLTEYDEKSIAEMIKTKTYKQWSTRNILNHLCKLGKLEPGEYMVDVSW